MASSAPSSSSHYKEDEECLVVVSFAHPGGPQSSLKKCLEGKLTGMDTAHPELTSEDGQVYVGTFKDTVGTVACFDSGNLGEAVSSVRYLGRSTKRLVFEIKGDEEEPKGGSADDGEGQAKGNKKAKKSNA